MSSRSHAARQVRRRLELETRVDVEVIWDKQSGSDGWCWQLHWSDGPTESAMRAMAERALHEIGSLASDGLRYAWLLTQPTIALVMIRQVRRGQPPLGEHRDLESFLDALDAESNPEHGSDEEPPQSNGWPSSATGSTGAWPRFLPRRGWSPSQSDDRATTSSRSTPYAAAETPNPFRGAASSADRCNSPQKAGDG